MPRDTFFMRDIAFNIQIMSRRPRFNAVAKSRRCGDVEPMSSRCEFAENAKFSKPTEFIRRRSGDIFSLKIVFDVSCELTPKENKKITISFSSVELYQAC